MVSITCLEFSYTQAPRKMKSVIMALFLMSVSLGNFFTAAVNNYIIVPEGMAPATRLVQGAMQDNSLDANRLHQNAVESDLKLTSQQDGTFVVELPISDPTTENAFSAAIVYGEGGELLEVRTSESGRLKSALQKIEAHWEEHTALPTDEAGSGLVGATRDQWGNPLQYDLKNNKLFLIMSLGPDGTIHTVDDIRLTVNRNVQTEAEKEMAASAGGELFAGLHPEEPWLARRQAEKGDDGQAVSTSGEDDGPEGFSSTVSLGGGEKLSGADYFWFFAQLMLVTACLFVIVAWFYKPREYLQEEAAA